MDTLHVVRPRINSSSPSSACLSARPRRVNGGPQPENSLPEQVETQPQAGNLRHGELSHLST